MGPTPLLWDMTRHSAWKTTGPGFNPEYSKLILQTRHSDPGAYKVRPHLTYHVVRLQVPMHPRVLFLNSIHDTSIIFMAS